MIHWFFLLEEIIKFLFKTEIWAYTPNPQQPPLPFGHINVSKDHQCWRPSRRKSPTMKALLSSTGSQELPDAGDHRCLEVTRGELSGSSRARNWRGAELKCTESHQYSLRWSDLKLHSGSRGPMAGLSDTSNWPQTALRIKVPGSILRGW